MPTVPPNAATGLPSQITSESAILSGSANPNGVATTIYFLSGTDTNYSAGQTIHQTIGLGASYVPVSGTLTGLIPSTTYHYLLVATSAGGSGTGGDLSFQTLDPPSVAVGGPAGVGYYAATLRGTVNAKGGNVSAYFEYGTTTGYEINRVNVTPATISGTSDTAVSGTLTNLSPATAYHYRLVAVSGTTSYPGGDQFFTTLGGLPLVGAGSSQVTAQGVVLSGSANPNGFTTSVHFEYGTDLTYSAGHTASQAIGLGTVYLPVSGTLTGLNPATTYHFRLVASSAAGTGTGSDVTFRTQDSPPPTALTGVANSIDFFAATLHGSVNPNGGNVSAHFEYGTTTGYGSRAPIMAALTGTSGVGVDVSLTGLNPSASYHYRLVAVSGTTGYPGGDLSFKTLGGSPVVNPVAVSQLYPPSRLVEVTASVNPNGTASSVHFEFGHTTAYSTLTGNVSLPAGVSASSVSVQQLFGFMPHTNYYVRCVASNAIGTGFSPDKMFRTAARTDLNGDGFPDLIAIVPRTGATTLLFTQNGARIGSVPGPRIPLALSFIGVGDFDGDGKTDWALFDANPKKRQVTFWYMNGGRFLRAVLGPKIPAGYDPVGVGDMIGDGKPDLILFNKTTKRTAVLRMNGLVALPGGPVVGPLLPPGFEIVAVDYLSGNARPDYLLWNSTNNQSKILVLNTTLKASQGTPIPGPVITRGWQLVGADAFTTSASANWLLYNPTSRATALWVMNKGKYVSRLPGFTLPPNTKLLPTK